MTTEEQTENGFKRDEFDVDFEGNVAKKAQWSNKFQCVIALLGYTVGLGNLWRFPYVCQRNGGGAFLIPHMIFTVIVAIPLFFLEAALGQFSRKGPIGVWGLCPLMKGIGFGILIISFIIVPYYSMMFAWALYYIYSSFSTVLPWTTCDNSWNTQRCVAVGDSKRIINNSTVIDESRFNKTNYFVQMNASSETNVSTELASVSGHTATEEFWQYKVLGISSGIDDLGTVQLHLFICWGLTCLLLFLSIVKGIKSLGKVVYVTALMPYILLTVLLVRACMMPGSMNGIMYYVNPDFSRLQHSQVWLEAILQVFFSVGPAWGTIIAMSSHNSPHNNVARDAILVTLLGELTSVFAGFVVFATVGFLAHDLGQPVTEVITSGPGIGFIVYPEAVSLLPFSQLWSVLFFLVVLMMGVDSMFGNIEAALGCIEDILPRRFHTKHLQTIMAAVLMSVVFLLGLLFTTSAGMYMYQLLDWYVAAVALFVIGTLECIIVGWCYGMKRFAVDVEAMIGKQLPIVFKLLCFIFVPVILTVAMFLTVTSYEPPSYGSYEYTPVAVTIGWCVAIAPVVPIPITMVIQILKERGSFAQRVKKATTPNRKWEEFKLLYGVETTSRYTIKENILFLFNR
ncbi:sodium- and chloride-dependent glycine transporter 1-like isoform X1 [Haliotis rufescens]|uniref:sodium- and chloride-dependent glycine transporter 1-like isoform X1 n=2 Tax=Haliotis rufescens TaxID=6454 RepID=UPI00201EC7A6|nr:sodium- and chloride-dependent glycine transporter 1-like isoform X1 [Haliotis rufescens]XP_046367053.2 sodium- and chloride-dependent glycine transporter 1-like isoform X1 [Haliotis rufescens]XP_046367054.2 sodium- and chloride-dependent glycine transporter 1-like isoform X1 [Haliotis rufescens]XP_048253844.1 sodium- and chloride-dependent glycine transporter 1-like isoform X1 [Haliotis rufescens]